MLDGIILGSIQGIVEWLPVSSEGVLVLAQTYFFQGRGLSDMIRLALFLHIGTFLAALVYFRRDVRRILKGLVRYRQSKKDTQKTIVFLAVSTLISGIIGIGFLTVLKSHEGNIFSQSAFITGGVGVLLIITGFLHVRSQRKKGSREIEDLTFIDGIVLGVVQGAAALPGLSRSGLTVSALLLLGIKETESLRLSFLMSLPIVLFGNIALNSDQAIVTGDSLLGLLFAFIFGIATIHFLLRIARKIKMGYFTLNFGLLAILAALVQ